MRSGDLRSRIVGLLLASVLLASCWGQTVRLGESATGGDSSRGGSTAMQGGAGGDVMPASGGESGAAACAPSNVTAEEVLWVGDTWVTIPGDQHTRVRDFARAEGLIGPNEEYAIAAAPFAAISDVIQQYEDRQAGSMKVKVLVGDGGTWDTIAGQGSEASVARAVSGLTELLNLLARDGTVQHFIYYLPPELPMIPGVAALRPRLRQACLAASVPCHFIDLQPFWVGHPEYTSDDGIQASALGARVIADAVWQKMKEECIAQ